MPEREGSREKAAEAAFEANQEEERVRERCAADAKLTVEVMGSAGEIRQGEKYNVVVEGNNVKCEALIFMGPHVPGQDNSDRFCTRMEALGYKVDVDPDYANMNGDYFPVIYTVSDRHTHEDGLITRLTNYAERK